MTPAVLGIDPGQKSGWGVVHEGRRIMSGSCNPLTRNRSSELRYPNALAIVTNAASWAQAHGTVLMVCREDWNTAGMVKAGYSGKTPLGLGRSWGNWEMCLAVAGIPRKKHVIAAKPAEWRKPFNIPNNTTARAKQAAMATVRTRLGGYLCEDDNEAEALCIAMYGEHAPELLALFEKLTKGRNKAAS